MSCFEAIRQFRSLLYFWPDVSLLAISNKCRNVQENRLTVFVLDFINIQRSTKCTTALLIYLIIISKQEGHLHYLKYITKAYFPYTSFQISLYFIITTIWTRVVKNIIYMLYNIIIIKIKWINYFITFVQKCLIS